MFKNTFKSTLRNPGKHKAGTTINMAGLCVAFTSALLLFSSVYYEFSFDGFRKNANSIYHLYYNTYNNIGVDKSSAMEFPYCHL